MTKIKQFDIWIAHLRKSDGTELGKRRPVVILQSNLLNNLDHPSTVICSISSQERDGLSMLRIPISPDEFNGLDKNSHIVCDQIRTLDNLRLEKRIGQLNLQYVKQLKKTINTILGF